MSACRSLTAAAREFAGALNSAMERLFDTVETFYSPEIPAGEQWLNMIEEELSNTDFGTSA
jgi:hypothetical protein